MTPAKRVALAALTFCAAVVVVLPWHPPPLLIWNASASAPIGLYRVQSPRALSRGELVLIAPPEPLSAFLAGRGYLPKGVLLLKHVAAVRRQSVCRRGAVVVIDGVTAATAGAVDRIGRPLPSWHGCRVLSEREVFVLNAPADSLDSRYFGALPISSVIGRAVPLWLMKDH
jgi:conjugative transfer signal peptidase TraF